MEPLNVAVAVVVCVLVLIILVRLIMQAVSRRERQYSRTSLITIQVAGIEIDAKYEKHMAEYVRLGSRLTPSLMDKLDTLITEIESWITYANFKLMHLTPEDQKMVVERRDKWRRYLQDIDRISGLLGGD